MVDREYKQSENEGKFMRMEETDIISHCAPVVSTMVQAKYLELESTHVFRTECSIAEHILRYKYRQVTVQTFQ